MLQKKSQARMVSFRLSSAEYEAALAVCQAHGFRSMSLLARSAFLAFLAQPKRETMCTEAELTDIHQRLAFLTDELNRVAAIVDTADEEEPKYPRVLANAAP